MTTPFFGKVDRRKKRKERRTCPCCGAMFKALPKSSQVYCGPACLDASVGGTPAERIERNTDRSTGCWVWTATLNRAGYGIMSVGGKTKLVHRESWRVHRGKLTAGKVLCHTCHNRACCNPAHLYEGTQADNMRDMSEANRGGSTKTSWLDRRVMAASVLLGEPVKTVAERYGVSAATVRRWASSQALGK